MSYPLFSSYNVALLIASLKSVASLSLFLAPSPTARLFGLPLHALPTHAPWIRILGGRSLIVPISLFTFAYQAQHGAMGVVMLAATVSAFIDAWICGVHGDRGKAWGHGLAAIGMGLAGWKLFVVNE